MIIKAIEIILTLAILAAGIYAVLTPYLQTGGVA